MQSPRILLADEPTSALDACSCSEIVELLTRLAQERRMTLLVAMHDAEIARRFASHIIEINRGTVREKTSLSGTSNETHSADSDI